MPLWRLGAWDDHQCYTLLVPLTKSQLLDGYINDGPVLTYTNSVMPSIVMDLSASLHSLHPISHPR